ncbi:MAG: hypothetical protein ACRDQ1_16550 [Sciscionella sp.]
MMRHTIWTLVIGLVVLILALPAATALGDIGPVELGIWIALVIVWVVAVFTIGRRNNRKQGEG